MGYKYNVIFDDSLLINLSFSSFILERCPLNKPPVRIALKLRKIILKLYENIPGKTANFRATW